MFIKICTVPFRVVITMANMPSNKTQTNKTDNYRKNHNAVHQRVVYKVPFIYTKKQNKNYKGLSILSQFAKDSLVPREF